MVVIAIMALVVSIRRYNRIKQLNIFTWYCLASILQTVYLPLALLNGPSLMARWINHLLINIFLITEFTIFSWFLYHSISSVKVRRSIKFVSILFLLFLLACWINEPSSFYKIFSPSLFALESLLLFFPCLFYLYEQLKTLDTGSLKDRYSFWIIMGILLLSTCSLPLFLLTNVIEIQVSDNVFAINFILYSLLFLTFIRAYYCKPPAKVS